VQIEDAILKSSYLVTTDEP